MTTGASEITTTVTAEGPTVHKFTLHSASMKRAINVAVMLPPACENRPDARFPVLYAMHGMGAPWGTYMEMAPLRSTLRERPMIVVTFDGDQAGWYIDAPKKSDNQFTTFFFNELIPYIDKTYRTRSDSAGRGVTGFSMGGFGAFHFMLTHPERIGSASALSGAFTFVDVASERRMDSQTPLLGAYAENKADYERQEIFPRLADLVAKGIALPPMFVHCGTEDWIIASGRRLLALLLAHNEVLSAAGRKPLDFQYRESAGGHNWPFWRDASVGIAEFHWRCFTGAAGSM